MFYYDANGFLCKESEAVGYTDIAPAETLNRAMFTGEAWVESLYKRAWAIDEHGFFVVDLFDYDVREGGLFTTIPCPSGMFRRPRLMQGEWVEGLPVTANELLEREKRKALRRVNSEHLARLGGGVPFMFGNTLDTVQTRDERDMINISGVATRAMLLQAQGVQEPVISFRAQSNTTYPLTPAQAVALGEAVADHQQQIYSTTWLLKDAIASATSVEAVMAIGWPQGE